MIAILLKRVRGSYLTRLEAQQQEHPIIAEGVPNTPLVDKIRCKVLCCSALAINCQVLCQSKGHLDSRLRMVRRQSVVQEFSRKLSEGAGGSCHMLLCSGTF